MDFKLKYVSRERMPSGRWRYRFQRGKVKTSLPGEPGSREFMAAYAGLLDGIDYAPGMAEKRLVTGSIAWLVGEFLAHVEKNVAAGLAGAKTLKGHRHHLGRLVARHGAKTADLPRSALVVFLDEFTATPGARDNLRKSISAMYQWAIERELVTCPNPAKGIKRINTKSSGFYSCTIEDIRKYLAHHPHGTNARRVMVMALCTAARREDLRLLGSEHEVTRKGIVWLRWRQSKPPHDHVEIPMLPTLQRELEGHTGGPYLLNAWGRPYTHGGIGNAVRGWFDEAGVQGSLHGVRKGLSSILPQLGASSYEIDVLLGHRMGSAESQVYVANAKRGEIAELLTSRMGGLDL